MNNPRERWYQCQQNLIEWRDKYPMSDRDCLPAYRETVSILLAEKVTGKLLEIGCKSGGLRLAENWPTSLEYFGLDPIRLKENYDFEFQQTTGEEMSYNDNFFDAALIRDSVDCFFDQYRTFSNIYRVLMPSGVLIISEGDHHKKRAKLIVAAKDVIQKVFRYKLKGANTIVEEAHATYPNGDLSRNEIVKLIKECGLNITTNKILRSRLTIVARK